jgi:hypothetical protein
MATELHRILEGFIDTATGRPANPTVHGENAFLVRVVTPICDIILAEAESYRDGKAPHNAWRNYDDINEYFWRRDVFDCRAGRARPTSQWTWVAGVRCRPPRVSAQARLPDRALSRSNRLGRGDPLPVVSETAPLHPTSQQPLVLSLFGPYRIFLLYPCKNLFLISETHE